MLTGEQQFTGREGEKGQVRHREHAKAQRWGPWCLAA